MDNDAQSSRWPCESSHVEGACGPDAEDVWRAELDQHFLEFVRAVLEEVSGRRFTSEQELERYITKRYEQHRKIRSRNSDPQPI